MKLNALDITAVCAELDGCPLRGKRAIGFWSRRAAGEYR